MNSVPDTPIAQGESWVTVFNDPGDNSVARHHYGVVIIALNEEPVADSLRVTLGVWGAHIHVRTGDEADRIRLAYADDGIAWIVGVEEDALCYCEGQP